jgi:hypothetical protein
MMGGKGDSRSGGKGKGMMGGKGSGSRSSDYLTVSGSIRQSASVSAAFSAAGLAAANLFLIVPDWS